MTVTEDVCVAICDGATNSPKLLSRRACDVTSVVMGDLSEVRVTEEEHYFGTK